MPFSLKSFLAEVKIFIFRPKTMDYRLFTYAGEGTTYLQSLQNIHYGNSYFSCPSQSEYSSEYVETLKLKVDHLESRLEKVSYNAVYLFV